MNMPVNGATLGMRIQNARRRAKLSQDNLSNAVGITAHKLRCVENDTTVIPDPVLLKIAMAVNVNYTDLKFGPSKAEIKPDLTTDIKRLADHILTNFNPNDQAIILIEEMAELTQVLCKIQRGRMDKDKLIEEFTHVQVSCEVIKQLMRIPEQNIHEEVLAKLGKYVA